MPIELTNEQPLSSLSFDSVKINSYTVNANKGLLLIHYSKSLGAVVVENSAVHIIKEQAFIDIISFIPIAGLSRYDDTKKALYDVLIADLGLVGAIV